MASTLRKMKMKVKMKVIQSKFECTAFERWHERWQVAETIAAGIAKVLDEYNL